MLNIVWTLLIVVSVLYGFATGRAPEVGNAFFEGAGGCINFILKTGTIMVLWQAVLNVADAGGLSKKLADLFSPVICKIFKGVKKGSKSALLIANNITANMLGLSNAATPMGMAAMKELSKKSRHSIATDDMCLLAVINSASLQLVPSTLIAMRASAQSTSPAGITVPIWIVSSLTVIFAIIMAKTMENFSFDPGLKGGHFDS